MIGQTEVPDEYLEDDTDLARFNEDDLKRELTIGRLSDRESIRDYDE